MKIENCKVLMLPSNAKEEIDIPLSVYSDGTNKKYQVGYKGGNPQHLYVTSKIKSYTQVLWYIDETNAVRNKVTDDQDYWQARVGLYTKIVATTDRSLGLPIIPESFVREYVAHGGDIDFVSVDMEYVCKNGHTMNAGFENLTCTYPHCGELIKAKAKSIIYND